jgi:protocatechuate 3,4-dioxygenase beta subunit
VPVRFLGIFGLVVAALVALSLGTTTASGATSACKPTLADGFGPWAQGAKGEPPRRSVFGSGFTLSGKVLRAGDCKPVKGAVVEVWQETPGRGYIRRGRASVVTDGTGAFRFVGPVPLPEGGRPGHIHIRVTESSSDEVSATQFVSPGSRRASLTIVLTDSAL